MKLATKLVIATVATITTTLAGTGIVHAVAAPGLPTEQQALVDAGFTKNATWAEFTKKTGSCTTTVQMSGKNYYVFTKGKLNSTLYPVIPKQLVNAVTLMNANCQG